VSAGKRATAVGGLILAAGESRRFGSPKQLALLDGRPLLEHALSAMAAAKSVERTVVVLGSHASEIVAGVRLDGALAVICDDWNEGQAASLRAGVEALADLAAAIVVTLGDQPLIDPRAIDRVVAARGGGAAAVRAGYLGRPGHPVVFERELFEPARRLRGDEGARGLLATVDVRVVACDGLGSDADVDTPDQLVLSAGGSSSQC
jgi:CTP:molybdopterin cytidylyltransferase MocA